VLLAGQIRRAQNHVQGELTQLQLKPIHSPVWQLAHAADFNIRSPQLQVDDICLQAEGGGFICTQANWPQEGVSLRGQNLPLVLLQPLLPLSEGRRLHVRGEIGFEAQVQPRGATWDGRLHLYSPEGGIRIGDSGHEEAFRYDRLDARIQMDADGIINTLHIGFQDEGYIDAQVELERSPGMAIQGELRTQINNLYWLELFSPDLVQPRGVIEGYLRLEGTREQPLLGGQARLRDFSAELPALGLTLNQGEGLFAAQADGSARILARAHTGGSGALQVDGDLSWLDKDHPIRLQVSGQNVLLADIPELRLIGNPDLNLSLNGQTVELRGRLEIPEARVDLQRLDRGTAASSDVVVLDPAEPETTGAALDMDIVVNLGKKVALSGFGLKGQLGGQLQLRARPGQETTANGRLNINGRYKAYGQDLTITQGQLWWNHDIVSDPRLNIRAQRVVDEVTAGIDVSGRAHQPWVEIWSEPDMSQSESLAYLILGRSLSLVSNDEAQQINATSAAFTTGSSLLAAQLGARLGLDDAGVNQSRALGGNVVGIGKYITPRLYVGYGVLLVGTGSVLTLKYLLRRGFDVEIETSTVENRSSLNWRHER